MHGVLLCRFRLSGEKTFLGEQGASSVSVKQRPGCVRGFGAWTLGVKMESWWAQARESARPMGQTQMPCFCL